MRQIILNLDATDNKLYYQNLIREGENLASELVINLSEEFKGYRYTLKFKNNESLEVITPELIAFENQIKYVITNALTREEGTLKIELNAFDDAGMLKKTATTTLRVLDALGETDEVIPEAYAPWYIKVFDLVENFTTEEDSRQQAEIKREQVKDTLQGWLDNPEQFKGEQGIQGIQGEQGIQGIQGPKGEKGDTGEKGEPGEVTQVEFDNLSQEFTAHKEDYANLATEVNKKANKQQEGWITPTLLNGWVNGIVPVRYMKDTMGFVHIEGIVKDGTAGVVFNLPSGYRPSRSIFEVGMKNALATTHAIQLFEVRSMGDVRLYAESGNWNINFAFKVSYFVGVV